jgi:Phosphotransferase system mannitol/fructose-specific IIA domain (Ntr-type)
LIIDGQTALILEQLLDNYEPISSSGIAKNLGVSTSNVNLYLNHVEDLVGEFGAQLKKTPGIGIMLIADDKVRQKLTHMLFANVDHSFFYNYRKKYMLDILFSGAKNYTMQIFADELLVSKTTILKDLERIDAWLQKYDIALERRRNSGVSLVGHEEDIREAIIDNNRSARLTMSDNSKTFAIYNLDYRIKQFFFHYITETYPEISIPTIQSELQESEQSLGIRYTDDGFCQIFEYIVVVATRSKLGCSVGNHYNYSDVIDEGLRYRESLRIFKKLGIIREYSSLPAEAQRLAAYLTVCPKQTPDLLLVDETQTDYNAVSYEFTRAAGKMLQLPLEDDGLLIGAVANYLGESASYSRYGIRRNFTIESDIKKNQSRLYGVCFAAVAEIEDKVGFVLRDKDIEGLVILLSNSVEKQKKTVNAVLVTATGYQISKYIANRICDRIPWLEFDSIMLYDEVMTKGLPRNKLVVSTVPLESKYAVCIKCNVNYDDVFKIKEAIGEYLQAQQPHGKTTSIKDVFTLDMIETECTLKTKQSVIEYGCQLLFENGCVDEEYVSNVLEREVFSPTAIGNGIAIPHGRQELIKETGIAVLRLKKPVAWTEDDKVTLVFLLALKFSESEQIRNFIRKFYSLIGEKKIIEDLKNASDSEAFISILHTYRETDEQKP